MLEEVDAVEDFFVPAGGGEVGEEADEFEEEADTDGLLEARLAGDWEQCRATVSYRYGDQKPDGYTGQHREAGLLVMLIGEDVWILQCPKGAYDCELSATQNGIGLEVAHLGRCPSCIIRWT